MPSQKVNVLVDQESVPVHSVAPLLLQFAEKLGKLNKLHAYADWSDQDQAKAVLEKAGFTTIEVPPEDDIDLRITRDCMKLSAQTAPEVYIFAVQVGDYEEPMRLLKARNKGVILFTQRSFKGRPRWLKLADYHYFLEDLSPTTARSTKTAKLPKFRNTQLLQQALTHRSYANEMDHEDEQNERLEFLGDSILNFLCGEFLFQYFPEKPEGELTTLRSALVNEKQLAEFAQQLKLGQQLRLGKGAEHDGARNRPSVLSGAFEALVGAYFIDSGSNIDTVRSFVLPLFESITDRMETVAPPVNYKSEFQHWATVNRGENPFYTMIAAVGPDHNRQFTVEVSVRGKKYGQGTGRRKQDAEKEAARDALEALGLL